MRKLAAGLCLSALASGCGAHSMDPSEQAKRARIAEMYADYKDEFAAVSDISASELMSWLQGENAQVVIVDVREDAEQAVSTIPGAISRAEFEANAEGYADQSVIVYCTIGYRSGKYAETLGATRGEVYNLKGSVLSWAHEGGVFTGPDGEATNRVHVYGDTWNLLPEGYEAIW